jgi:hypothetical protein
MNSGGKDTRVAATNTRWLRSAAASLCIVGMGCSDAPLRLPVTGEVRLDGAPLETGALLMTPTKSGPVAGCDIQGGRFEMSEDRGPGPGEYRVEITAYRPTGKKVYDSDFNVSTETLVAIVPARYNTQSELTATVRADGANHFNFDLHSK